MLKKIECVFASAFCRLLFYCYYIDRTSPILLPFFIGKMRAKRNAWQLGSSLSFMIFLFFVIPVPLLAQQTIYFPHIASNSTWETEICVINTSAVKSLSGNLRAYNDSGQEVFSTPIILAANARRQILIGDELPNPSDIGYIIFESDAENACGYTKFYIEGKYRVAVPAVSDINAGDIYMSHIASSTDWWTGISILNTTSSSKELTVEFDNGTTKPITMAAKEHKKFTINSLFGGVLQPNIKSAVIKNGSGILGLELFGSSDSSGDNYLGGILLTDDTMTCIYYPHIASNSTWWTGIVAYNPSASPCTLTITPFTEDGGSLESQSLTISGHEKYVGMVANLGLPADTAWFEIRATSPVTGFELFGTTDGNQLAEYTGVGLQGKKGVFPKLEHDGWTGIAFVNIGYSYALVNLTAYDDLGHIVATNEFTLKPHQKVLGVSKNLFADDITAASYMAYSCDKFIVGFQINGSSDSAMSDGLPTMQGGNLLSHGIVNLPSRLIPESVSVHTSADVQSVDKNGFFPLDKEVRLSHYLAIASVNGFPVGMSFFDPGSKEKTISCEETAISLLILNTPLFATPVHLFSDLISELKDIPEVTVLANQICLDLSQRDDALVNPSEALDQAFLSASVSSFNSIFNMNAQP